MTFKLRPGINTGGGKTASERHYRINPDNSQTTIASGTPIVSYEYDHVQGYDVVNYHKLKRKGELIPITPWYQYHSDFSFTGKLHYVQPAVPYNWKTDANWSHPISLTPWSILETDIAAIANGKDTTRYIQQAAASIYSSGFDALTFLSEVHKTLAMFKNAVKKLANLATEWAKWKARKGNGLKTLADFWLEYRYGWRLLYFDIVDISQVLAELGHKRNRFMQKCGASTETPKSVNYSYNGPAFQFTVTMIENLKISLRGIVVADVEPPKFQFNPLTTSWELIRFSFIIDWFIGIGQWLETISFLALQTHYSAAGGVQYLLSRTMQISNSSASAGYSVVTCETLGIATASLTMRNPQSVPNFPLINVRLDVPKVTDLLAIIYGFYIGQTPRPGTRL